MSNLSDFLEQYETGSPQVNLADFFTLVHMKTHKINKLAKRIQYGISSPLSVGITATSTSGLFSLPKTLRKHMSPADYAIVTTDFSGSSPSDEGELDTAFNEPKGLYVNLRGHTAGIGIAHMRFMARKNRLDNVILHIDDVQRGEAVPSCNIQGYRLILQTNGSITEFGIDSIPATLRDYLRN